jgi:Ca2+/Na+ antiporter
VLINPQVFRPRCQRNHHSHHTRILYFLSVLVQGRCPTASTLMVSAIISIRLVPTFSRACFTPSIEIISIIPFYSIITLVVYCFVHHLAVSFVVIVLLVAYLSYALFIYLMSSTKRVKQHARITISQRARRPHSQRLDTVSENVHDVVSPLLRPLWKPKCHADRHLRADKGLP